MSEDQSEQRAAWLSMLVAALSIAHQVAAKSLRDGLFLATFSVPDLPKAMLGSALVAIPVAIGLARVMARLGPGRVAPALFAASALLSVAEGSLLALHPRAVVALLYAHVSIGGALLLSSFWSIVNERFDPLTLKRLVGRIGASATFGGLLGGLVMERATHWMGARSGLALVACLALAAAGGSARLATMWPPGGNPPPTVVAASPLGNYLWTLAWLVAGSALMSAFGDFALKQAAAARFERVEELVRFFAVFYTAASLASFAVQVVVLPRLLEHVGVGGTLQTPPAVGLGLGVLALAWPTLPTVAALRASDLTLGPSLFRSAFEPLFTPVPTALKRRAKALIDVVFDKGGDVLSSALILLLVRAGHAWLERGPLVLSCVASLFAWLLSRRASRGYVMALESSLRDRAARVSPEEREASRHVGLSATALGIDRRQLLSHLAAFSETAGLSGRTRLSRADEQLLADVRGVLVGGSARALALERTSLDPRLAPFVVPLLADDHEAPRAVAALRGMGDAVAGVLTDALLDREGPLAVQRRIPHVLRFLRSERAARALKLGLSAQVLEVRYRCALALREVSAHDAALGPDAEQVYALVMSELAGAPLTRASIDHVFALLGLISHNSALELVRQGVLSEDRKLRGTALEYLGSLLPESVRAPLISALFQGYEPARVASRPPEEAAAELRESMQGRLAPALSTVLDVDSSD